MLKITRAVAWILVIGLIVIALVPAPLRPGTGVSHNFEHFGSFLLAGILWCLAYADRLLLWLGTSVVFAGGIELLQILMPGRHARFTDFAADALGGCAGLLITFLVTRRYGRRIAQAFRAPAVCCRVDCRSLLAETCVPSIEELSHRQWRTKGFRMTGLGLDSVPS